MRGWIHISFHCTHLMKNLWGNGCRGKEPKAFLIHIDQEDGQKGD
jgi:hypothetical protein